MNNHDKKPNPVEEYMQKLIKDDDRPAQTTVEPTDQLQISNKPVVDSTSKSKASSHDKPDTYDHPKKMDPHGRVEQVNVDEQKIFDIQRHNIGLIFLYLFSIVGLSIGFTMIGFLLPDFAGSTGVAVKTAGVITGMFMLVIVFLTAIFLAFATMIYRKNRLILSNLNLTQVLQTSLFHRTVSELTMGNIEDVTAQKHGIFQTIFNYGTIVVETAGEQHNFIFKWAPNPDAHAKAIQDARGAFLTKHKKH